MANLEPSVSCLVPNYTEQDKWLWICTSVVLCCRMCQRMAYICHHDSSISFSFHVNSNRTVMIPLYPWFVVCLTNFLHNIGCLVFGILFCQNNMLHNHECILWTCWSSMSLKLSKLGEFRIPNECYSIELQFCLLSSEVKVHRIIKGLHRLDYQENFLLSIS